MTITSADQDVITSVIDQWKSAVDAHEPERVGAVFTDDAIFQGLHPYGVGPSIVADYYASQPLGMAADYTVVETRRLADDVVLGYLAVEFSFVDRPVLPVFLSIVARRLNGAWKISHYQVSRLP